MELLAYLEGSVDQRYRSDLAQKFGLDLTKKCGAYSTGNRQKLLIIAALAKRPTVLICDEASTGLDPVMNRIFQEELSDAKDRGCGVLYSSHILSEVEALADRVYLLATGQVVDQGSVDSLKGLTARTVILQGCPHIGSLAALPGVDHFEHAGDRCSFQFTGETNALLKALSTTPVDAVSIQQPSLEEAFMSHYQETAQ